MLTCSVEVTVFTGPSLSNVWGDSEAMAGLMEMPGTLSGFAVRRGLLWKRHPLKRNALGTTLSTAELQTSL